VSDVATYTDWLPPGLELVALRLARADQLTFDLARLSFEWSKGPDDLGPLDLELIWVAPDKLDVVIRDIRRIPPLVTMLFSESVNHLRAAIDNTVFHLVSDARTTPLTDAQERRIAMPIYDDPARFDNWVAENRRKGVIELPDGDLIERISSLQPFADETAVSSVSDASAAMQSVTPDRVHPLLLLQGYSNEDKHRSVRLAGAQTTFQREDRPFWESDRSMRPVHVGDVLGTVDHEVLAISGTQPAVMVERPGGGVWVPPGRELDQLTQYVSATVIPMLVLGTTLAKALPVDIDLSDNGQTARERIEAGKWVTAQDRQARVSLSATLEAMSKPPRLLPTPPRPAKFDDAAHDH